MSKLMNKIDFVALIAVDRANANGDPLNGNRPRTDYNGFGEMSDVCIKRKLRNRMQDLGHNIFVQSEDRCDDGFGSLSERATAEMKGEKNRETYAQKACAKWLDVRTFGQVFAFKSDSVSVGVRGPVSIHQAVSASPVEIQSIQITKSVNGESGEKKASDTMGMKHFVRFGLYKIKGSINVQLAEKTGFTEEDAETVKECLRTLFVNDA
jgi:CRISPR-associated protein Csd2